MKLVQLLAKELKEWPEGAKYACQDTAGKYEGSVFFVSNEPEHIDGSGCWSVCGVIDAIYNLEVSSDAKINTVTKLQWQAEREKMNKPKWIRHRGGKCPVADDVKVLYRMRSGTITSRGEPSSILSWDHSKIGADIMAYRVIEETKDQEIEEVIPKHMAFGYASKEEMVAQIGEECPFAHVASAAEKTNFGTITYKLEIDATEATQQIDSLVAKWGQIESPLKWRDAIIHCQAIIEDCEREIERNVNLLDAEGLMMQKDSKKAMQHYAPDVDMSDWRNWQAGDIVECITSTYTGVYTMGQQYIVEWVDEDGFSVFDNYGGESSCDWFEHESEGLKFIRRP